jgi:murein DD-endopeptidase MepM/ murein hydrolase activator NlpD
VWPLGEGAPVPVGRGFAPPQTRYGAGHRGVDLVGPAGAVVRAAGGGRVSYAGLLAGRGVVVVVHGDLRTTYEPVSATVGVGQAVSAGDAIGVLSAGHAGCPAPACLHWGLRRGEQYLDPLLLVGAGPVRLLPLEAAAAVGATPPGPPPSATGPSPGAVVDTTGPDSETGDWGPLTAAGSPAGSALLALLATVVLLVRRRRTTGGAPGSAPSRPTASSPTASGGR